MNTLSPRLSTVEKTFHTNLKPVIGRVLNVYNYIIKSTHLNYLIKPSKGNIKPSKYNMHFQSPNHYIIGVQLKKVTFLILNSPSGSLQTIQTPPPLLSIHQNPSKTTIKPNISCVSTQNNPKETIKKKQEDDE